MAAPRNREIDFDFDFDSFVRAGEAKLCVRMRAEFPHRWGWSCRVVRLLLLRRRALLCLLFAGLRTGFKSFEGSIE